MGKKYKVKVTFLKACPFYELGEEVIFDNEEFFLMMSDKICTEAWDRISEYVQSALKDGMTPDNWIGEEEIMITCCNESPDPMLYKLERLYE